MVVDLGIFASGTTFAQSYQPPTASNPGALLQIVKQHLSPGGRYALFDPDLFYAGTIDQAQANLGILDDVPSVQGYGSLAGGTYSLRTGTHLRGYLNVAQLSIGYFRPLGLQVMLAPPEEFLTPIAAMPRRGIRANLSPIVENAGVDPLLPAGTYLPPIERLPVIAPSGPRSPIGPGDRSGWFFGTVMTPAAATLVLSHPAAGQLVQVGRVTSTGAVRWQPPKRLASGESILQLNVARLPSAGIDLRVLSGASLGPLQLTVGSGGRAYVVDGPLARTVTPASWTPVGDSQDFAVYRVDYAPEQAWVQALGTYAIAAHLPASLTILSENTDRATIAVRSPRASILVRDVAWDSGWHAEIVSGPSASSDRRQRKAVDGEGLAGGKSTPVLQVGVTQAVDIPAGFSIVRFSYTADGLSKGIAISSATAGVTVVVFLLVVVLSRRRRRRRPPDAFAPT
jgi:hypothetical protein